MFPISSIRIAQILGAPQGNVAANWPRIEQCLASLGIDDGRTCVAALATIRVECPPFKPIKEYGSATYIDDLYDTRTDLGNTPERDGDGLLYCGRGYIQITGRANYAKYGELLGLDLIGNPDLALVPDVAASIFAAFFQQSGCAAQAAARNYVRVRELVNGGHNGLSDFLGYIKKLGVEYAAQTQSGG
jgi:putative chitinase